jgi:hypothetical protein
VLDLVGQTRLGVNPKGGLVAPFPGLNGQPRRWIEVAPFVWRDLNSHERLAARLLDGKPARFSIDLISPFMVFQRPEWYRNTGWLLPVFLASVGALLLTVLAWPIAAVTRRQYGASLALDVPALRAYRLSRFGATAIVAALVLWTSLLAMMLQKNSMLNASTDWLLHLAQLSGIVAFLGGFVCMLINARAVWTGARRWPARTWSVVLCLSAFFVLWVAFVFHLMSFDVSY